MNLYQYEKSSPLAFVDPTGLAAYVLIYGDFDPMFKTWAEADKKKIETNSPTYYDEKAKKFDPAKDQIHMIPITGPQDFDQLNNITDIAYLASFGHGQNGKIWWGYKAKDGTERRAVTGIPGYRLAEPKVVDPIDFSRLAKLNFTACPLIEFYHCSTAQMFGVDKNGVLQYPDADPTHIEPKGPDGSARQESVISYFKQLLEQAHKGIQYRIMGSEGPIDNGWPWFRGWPRPTAGTEKKKTEP
jgi:hypothetical protein